MQLEFVAFVLAECKKYLPWCTCATMVTQYFSYDGYGNRTSSRQVDCRVCTEGAVESAYPYIRTETAYDANGNYTATTKGARGNVTTQSVNANDGTRTSVTDPAGQTVNYTCDASRRVTSV